jgi:hypothetical protein
MVATSKVDDEMPTDTIAYGDMMLDYPVCFPSTNAKHNSNFTCGGAQIVVSTVKFCHIFKVMSINGKYYRMCSTPLGMEKPNLKRKEVDEEPDDYEPATLKMCE